MAFLIYDAGNDYYFVATQRTDNSGHVDPVFGTEKQASRFPTQEQAANALVTLRGQHSSEFVDCKVVEKA